MAAVTCPSKGSPRLIIFTDLDGTLLDHYTYAWAPARKAIRSVQTHRWPLVFCTSKTRSEIERLQRQMGVSDPFIAENGGALFFPGNYRRWLPAAAFRTPPYLVLELGWKRSTVLGRLGRIRRLEELPIRTFSEMGVEEIAEVCGLPLRHARLALKREYDEPFSILPGAETKAPALLRKLEDSGFRLLRGGRFYHLSGPADKGTAVSRMLRILSRGDRHVHSLALGDAPNDLEMLRAADIPAIIRRDRRGIDPELMRALPNAIKPLSKGTLGWAEVVDRFLSDPKLACRLAARNK